jgi:hypothetical protein
MKMDKEFLIKHRFWVGLIAFVPVWLFAVLMLMSDVGGKAEKQKVFDEAVKNVKFSGAKNPSFLEPLKAQEETFRAQKDKVWKKAWDGQDGLMTWVPEGEQDDERAPFQRLYRKAYFGDDIPNYNQRLYWARNVYPKQFEAFNEAIHPAEYKDGVERVITRIYEWKDAKSVELWLAQEDFWVKREMVKAVKSAIDAVGTFKNVPLDAKNPKDAVPAGALARYRLRNPNWELDLIIEQRGKDRFISEKSKIKNVNVNQRVQKLDGVMFLVSESGEADGTAQWNIEGEPLAYLAEAEVRQSLNVSLLDPKKPPQIKQQFSWSTSPIKRLDRIEVGNRLAVCQRMETRGLSAKQIGKAEEGAEPAGEPAAAPPVAGGAPPGPGGAGAPPPGFGSGAFGGGEGGNQQRSATMTPNGLEMNRYIDLSDQVRRIPVAVVMIVDQAYVPDVLTALANSQLRMWTTQVYWQHVQGIRQQNAESAMVAGGGPPPGAGGFGPPRPGVGGPPPGVGSAVGPPGTPEGAGRTPRPRPGRGMPMPPGFPGPMGEGGGGAFSSVADEDDPNLVELVVYNIASLYERFPPRAPAGEQPAGSPPAPMGEKPAPMPMDEGNPPAGEKPATPMGEKPAPMGEGNNPPAPMGEKPAPAPKPMEGAPAPMNNNPPAPTPKP